MTERILITGVSGLIGSELAKYAIENDFEVVGSSRRHCESLRRQLGVPVIELDLERDGLSIPAVDIVVHTATANDVVSKNFVNGIELSVNGTQRLLEACVAAEVTKFVFFSTQQVYGDPNSLSGEITEASPVNCESTYALNHYFGEILCETYAKLHDLSIVLVRPANVVGVPSVDTVNRDGLVPTCFLKEIFEKNTITLRSSGRQRRDFISTSLLSQMVFSAIDRKSRQVSILNAAVGSTISVKRAADIMIEEFYSLYQKSASLESLEDEFEKINDFAVISELAVTKSQSFNHEEMLRLIIRDLLLKEGKKYERSP